jgi:peptide/nickel transport system permease protein
MLLAGSALSALSRGRALPASSKTALTKQYHLNDPFFAQYWYWLTNALRGNLGASIEWRQNVTTLMGGLVGTTAGLVLYAALIICVLGIGFGVLAGLKPGLYDTSTLVGTAITAAVPSFVASLVLVTVFAVQLRWFPALGNGTGFLDGIRHLTLPAIALALSSLAIVARVTRAAVREEAGREHVQTAVSRGIPYRLIIRRHILRNAAIPITTITGITIASLIAVDAVVETAFGLNGLGAFLVKAAQDKDLAVVQGISLVLVTAFVLVNLVVDVLYAALDPRVSLGTAAP